MKVEFNTTEYVSSHAKNPRGRGSWFFEVEAVDAFEVESGTKHWFTPSMTFTQAKAWITGAVKEWTAKEDIVAHHVYVKVGA